MSEKHEQYLANMHAVQTGVAHCMELKLDESTSPKHLRTGVNAAMVDSAALVRTLINKGLITLDEYETQLVIVSQEEKEAYEKKINEHHGVENRIKLG
jgi:hypothetical protein